MVCSVFRTEPGLQFLCQHIKNALSLPFALYCLQWHKSVCKTNTYMRYVCLHVPCRTGERRSPSCLLGAWPGHPVLPQLPTRVHCQALQAPLPRLWPRSVRRLLVGAPAGSVAGLGPPGARVHKLQPEARRALTGTAFLPRSTGENHSLTQLAVCHCFTSVTLMVLSCICGKEVFRHIYIYSRFGFQSSCGLCRTAGTCKLLDWVWNMHFHSGYSQSEFLDSYWHKTLILR